jgi:glycosyltransferase involved in cell wall biosynthesis
MRRPAAEPRTRVALLTEIIAPYRVEPFNLLAAQPGVQLEVLFFAKTEDRRSWRVPTERIRFPYRVLGGLSVGRMYQGAMLFLNPGVVTRLLRLRPHVVVCGGWHHPTLWLGLLAARLCGARVLVWSESTAADSRVPHRAKDALKRWMVARADGFVVPGAPQRDYLLSMGAPADRVWVAPNAVDNGHFAAGAALRETVRGELGLSGTVVVFVGRLLDEKGVPELLDAAAALRGSGATVLVVGDGPDAGRYRREAAERGLHNVVFAGFRDQDELPGLYSAADVFVFPTRSDPWGLVLNEAMAAGLPVVSSDAAGATRDLVRPGENGFVYPSGDGDALRDALLALVGDEALRARMGRRSREIVSAFTPAAMAGALAEAALRVRKGAPAAAPEPADAASGGPA